MMCCRALLLCGVVRQAFWLPSQQSESKDLMQKPDSATYCPASGKKLRLKDCVAVKFTRVREGESGLYMDPVTLETFTNASKLVVIAPTGEQGTRTARRTYIGLIVRCRILACTSDCLLDTRSCLPSNVLLVCAMHMPWCMLVAGLWTYGGTGDRAQLC
jgi:hypothetical protein